MIDPYITSINVEKHGLDENTTDRRELVKIAIDEMKFQEEGRNTVRRFISHALSNLSSNDCETLLKEIEKGEKQNNKHNRSSISVHQEYKNQNMRGYPKIRSKIEEGLVNYIDGEFIKDNEKALKSIRNTIIKYGIKDYHFESPDKIFSKNEKIKSLKT